MNEQAPAEVGMPSASKGFDEPTIDALLQRFLAAGEVSDDLATRFKAGVRAVAETVVKAAEAEASGLRQRVAELEARAARAGEHLGDLGRDHAGRHLPVDEAALVARTANDHDTVTMRDSKRAADEREAYLRAELAERKAFYEDCARADRESGRELMRQRDEARSERDAARAEARGHMRAKNQALQELAATRRDAEKMHEAMRARVEAAERELQRLRELESRSRCAALEDNAVASKGGGA